jgi:hypothetical protein
MSIFGNDTEKTDYEKIGVQVVKPYHHQGKWVFDKDGQRWPMAPAGITDATLSPIVVGADRLINLACQMKKIENPEAGFTLLFSEEYFPGCDVKFTYREPKYDGSVYNVEGVNLKGIVPDQQAWVCPYLTFYYQKPPQVLYLKVEANQ